ncbi:MAG: nuclear transport factor 2 family protein [Planctomycetaceae bacterium]
MRGVRTDGEQIAKLRKARGLTQEQLAAAADVDVTTLRRMEKGARRFDLRSVMSVADALAVDLCHLLPEVTANDVDQTAVNEEIVRHWHDAFLASDLELVLALHTEDTVLEIPAAEGLPAAGNFHGIAQLREHLTELFQLFKVRAVREDDFQLHAVEDLVFLRTTATIEFLPAQKTFTTRHLNEFAFRDGKIARRTVIADYGKLKQVLQQE